MVHTVSLGSVGVIAVDEERGQIVTWTSVDQSKAAARTLRAVNIPSLTQQFQQRLSQPSGKGPMVVRLTRLVLAPSRKAVHESMSLLLSLSWYLFIPSHRKGESGYTLPLYLVTDFL